ncbi:MAG: sulfotransferase domain-containing protein [Planctomycetaceae bacterium]|nr:sulfotransferase domain-containing protein [Planctomycetaceae bacterium]
MSTSSEIIVVSGLPRSGTSLMMQMLDRGGIPAVTDELRTPDVDNPRGYYEFEAVKRTKQDASWLPAARGRAVKLVSSLLYDLPATEAYRVLFMQRDLEEVLESQEKMLARLGNSAAPRDKMRAAFRVHLERLYEWLPQQSQMRVLMVDYNRLLLDAPTEVRSISDFLGGRATAESMLAAIDPSLYRNRASTS